MISTRNDSACIPQNNLRICWRQFEEIIDGTTKPPSAQREMRRQDAKAPRKQKRMSFSSWRLGVLAAHFLFFFASFVSSQSHILEGLSGITRHCRKRLSGIGQP